eukprot:TRINITY_DN19163_c0_g5_i1.p1 TRINITY_DN19163_c0_g5~~TRINITY_DN19163_c0_g5_i1.p1  ORF type:complete len:878 (+),score=201.48 TRINITY_DN19163_c0_g5_i1:95-2728(+)
MRAACWRCANLIQSCIDRPGDSEEERSQRRMLYPALLLCTTLTLVGIAGVRKLDFYAITVTIFFTGFMVGLVPLVCRMRISYKVLVRNSLLVVSCAILVGDMWLAARVQPRMWSHAVLVLDFFLVFQVERGAQLWVVALTMTYTAVERVEACARFGLYEGLRYNMAQEVQICDCSQPPCALAAFEGVQGWGNMCLVFILDFHVTRGFATRLRNQLNLIDTSVRVAERVAGLLAAYATADARQVVEEEGAALPEPLRESYVQLLNNLECYRDFLPDALLFAADTQESREPRSPLGDRGESPPGTPRQHRWVAPGLGVDDPSVAVCFTDIQSSTELWEGHPRGMYEALHMHNRMMRTAYGSSNGYEVKTIGDSFMVAFRDQLDALKFGLAAQLGLVEQKWPEDLLQHRLCQKVRTAAGQVLWNGLRVRIGMNYGPANVERNPVTGRCDYFGSTVNTAARLESVLRQGGLVATTDAVVKALGQEGMCTLGFPAAQSAGDRELKGVRFPVSVWALVPQQLSQRIAVLLGGSPASGSARELSVDSKNSGLKPLPSRHGVRTELPGMLRPIQTLPLEESISLAADRLSSSDTLFSSMRERSSAAISLRLTRSSATCITVRCALVRAEPIADRFAAFAAAAALAADQTLGVVDSVLSAGVAVSWNASRPCVSHSSSGRHFLAAPFRVPCHLGVASGGVLSGNVAAGRRGFATVIGGCVELAAALAEEAERCGDAALGTGAVAELCEAADAASWAQLWPVPGQGPHVVLALEGRREEKWDLSLGAPAEESSSGERAAPFAGARWADHLAGLFHQACAGEPGSEAQRDVLAELRGGSWAEHPKAQRLAERIERGAVRSRPLPRLWNAESAADGRSPPAPGLGLVPW